MKAKALTQTLSRRERAQSRGARIPLSRLREKVGVRADV